MPARAKCLVGQTFNRLTVLERAGSCSNGAVLWKCQCTCGEVTDVMSNRLRSGRTKSCGCLIAERQTTHGESSARKGKKSKTYAAWASMLSRCYNKKHPAYCDYGGRGITVCDRWRSSYEAFRDDMGSAPANHSLDRIENDQGYSPGNCRWADQKTQLRNTRVTHNVTLDGVTKCFKDWCLHFKISRGAVYRRHVKLGWSIERALRTPPVKY